MAKSKTAKAPTKVKKDLFGNPIAVAEPEEKMKSSEPQLFDIIGMMFSNPKKFSAMSTYEKGKNFFMTQRIFAMKYPLQAAAFNNLRVNGGHVCQYWCDALSPIFNRSPEWIWKGFKAIRTTKNTEKAKTAAISEETITWYCNKYQCSRRDFKQAMELFPESFIEELKELEKVLSNKASKK